MSRRWSSMSCFCCCLLLPIGFIRACSGGHQVLGTTPNLCPPSGTNPPGGFCVGIKDLTTTGATSWHATGTMSGSWVQDGTTPPPQGSTVSFTNRNPWPSYVVGGRAPATWSGTAGTSDSCMPPGGEAWGPTSVGIGGTLAPLSCNPAAASSSFALTNSIPSTLTIQATGFSSTYGMPQINVYDGNMNFVSQSLATSVAPDGSSATFNYPTQSNGSALVSEHYTFNVANKTSSGGFLEIAANFFSLGSNDTSLTTPYGVDAADITTSGQHCRFVNFTVGVQCDPPWGPTTTQAKNVTLSSLGQVRNINGVTLTVGTQPTAVMSYNVVTNTTHPDQFGGYQNTTQPSKAIVTNFGSNTVSILDLINNTVTNTISVGTQPITVALNSGATKAYVANFGSASVSEVDLSTLAQTRVVSVGSSPAAVAMDAGGTAIWVGGLNYISKVDVSSFSVVQTFSVSGQVTSIAVSSGQNSLVYTLYSSGSGGFSAQQAAISNGVSQGTYAQYSVSGSNYYAQSQSTCSGNCPPPGWLMSTGAMVSAPYNNRFAVLGTPTGFAVVDLLNKTTVLQGSTPSAVRGIATDNDMIYLTAPDSNSLISVPFPPTS